MSLDIDILLDYRFTVWFTMTHVLVTGLQSGYYDACAGWVPTVERIHYAQFSLPFVVSDPSYFFYKKGGSFDLNNFNNDKKFGRY